MKKRALRYGGVLLLFLLVAVAFFHGVARHPESRMAYGPGDGTSTIREFWLDSLEHKSPFTLTHDPFNAAPEGTDIAPATFVANAGIQTVLVWGLRNITGTVLAWNLYLFVGLVGSGIAMFVFLEFLGCTFLASLFGGYVLAFSPYAIAHAIAGHIGFDQNWTLVITAFAMLSVRKRRTFTSGAVAGASIALAFYVSAYQGLFAGVVALAFLIVDLWRVRSRADRIRSLSLLTMTYLSAAVALLPVLVLYKTEQSVVTVSETHSLNDLYTFAARVTSYAVPSPQNPLFHWVRGFHPTDISEQTLFIGYTTWLLAVVAVVLLFRRNSRLHSSDVRWWTAITMAVLAPAAFILSLPPAYHIGPVLIPMPSCLLGLTTAFWRVYSRFGVVVAFSLAVLAALGITCLDQRPGRAWRLVAPIALLLVVLELLPGNIPAFDVKNRPGWVAWLNTHPHGIVALYPLYSPPDAVTAVDSAAFWYQRLDGDPNFNFEQLSFAESHSRQNAIRTLSRNLNDALTPRILATEGVSYVVVDGPIYDKQGVRVPKPDPRFYNLLNERDGVLIYAVRAPHLDIAQTINKNARLIKRLQGGLTPADPG